MIYFLYFSDKGSKISIVNRDTDRDYLFLVIAQKRIFCHYILNEDIFHEAYLFCYFLCDYDTSKLTGNN